MMNARAMATVSLLALSAASSVAEVVCGGGPLRLRMGGARYVAIARVESEEQAAAGGTTYKLKNLRSYKNRRRDFLAYSRRGEDDGNLTVGDYVVVFAETESFTFDSCSQPISLSREIARAFVEAEDRKRRLPPFTVPREVLYGPAQDR